MNIKLSAPYVTLCLIFMLIVVFVNADFLQPKKLTKGQLKQKIAEYYEVILRQTSKIAEVNALLQQELHEHIAKLINDDQKSIFKTHSLHDLNHYYDKLKQVAAENDKEVNRLIQSLHGLKLNFSEPKLNNTENKNN